MRRAIFILLPAFVAHGQVDDFGPTHLLRQKDPANNLADKLIDGVSRRAIERRWPLSPAELDSTTVAKGPDLLALRRTPLVEQQHHHISSFVRPAPSSRATARVQHIFRDGSSHIVRSSLWPVGQNNIDEGVSATAKSVPVLDDDLCLMPGQVMVRIEDAPGNAVRIFAGIDIVAPMQSVWEVLTDYDNLQKVIPNLVESKVLERDEQGGARMEQIGSATVLPGIRFTAKMVVEVKVFYEDNPLPEQQIADHLGRNAGSDDVRAFDAKLPLVRGVFPRPFAISSLPHRDITMANDNKAPGDFEHYQGVWRLQTLPNCGPDGEDACRVTYAVEIKPSGWLPVKLIERRIASDLEANLVALRKFVEGNDAGPKARSSLSEVP
eukprot:gnl/TRDRNA2_/TRDRNA2_157760_c1_seq1.p1 gnl/TRDRNA2_/TRDRNA2_157760_c1~~gnl/TRDRNA2_/TRDRNA2_157760_c1_seq1.p1  ORF type:complete len:380 (-),score=47.12 gnl/TRDRNA2_/TRDRNA2_157760_c1_seq1:30-1169(-)